MPDTYELGSIPPISVWEGQTVKFSVRRHSGAADFIMDVKPGPKGKIAINKSKGDFSCAPAAED